MVYNAINPTRTLQLASAKRAIIEIACRNHTTVQEVKESISTAIEAAFNKPGGRELFAKIPSEAEIPTPEEFIAWAGAQIL